jgi:ubiquinol oxidase
MNEEAENERMHLLIWLQVTHPTKLERMIVVAAQLLYTVFYSSLYMVSGRAAHRLTGCRYPVSSLKYAESIPLILSDPTH